MGERTSANLPGCSALVSARESVHTQDVQFVCQGGEEGGTGGGGELLLQVAVDFKAVVSRIGNHNVSVGGKSQSLRAVQRVCWRVDVRQEWTAAVKHLT